jgi:hypothetical protein
MACAIGYILSPLKRLYLINFQPAAQLTGKSPYLRKSLISCSVRIILPTKASLCDNIPIFRYGGFSGVSSSLNPFYPP